MINELPPRDPNEFVDHEDPAFQEAVREHFATLLEDRATDPERGELGASQALFDFAEEVRAGKKIARRAGTLEIFRGVFNGGPISDYCLSQHEIDWLEKYFFDE